MVGVVLLAAFLGACGAGDSSGGNSHPASGPSPSQGPNLTNDAVGATLSTVAKGTVAALPEGTLIITAANIGTGTSPSGPGIVFDSAAGTAVFSDGSTPLPTRGLFITVRAASERASVGGSGYATDDLPPLPRINQTEALNLGRLDRGGHSANLKSGGVEVIYVITGSVDVEAGTIPGGKVLSAGQAVFVLDNTPVQVINKAAGPSTYLAFFLVRDPAVLERPPGN